MSALGQNVNSPDLEETPKRHIKFLSEFLRPRDFKFTLFDAPYVEDMVIEKQIEFYSLCEHHILPFFGYAHIGYIPTGKVVGLSKLARTVEKFASNLQTQERLTHQIADFLEARLNASVIVVLEASHMCMSMRGVRSPQARTITSAVRGAFKDDPSTKKEFYDAIGRV